MIFRVRPRGRDNHGDVIDGVPSRRLLPGATVAPRTSSDVSTDTRDGVVVGLTLFSPDPSIDVLPSDLIEVHGVPYRIVGDVGRYESPFGAGADGATCALERGQG